MTNKLKGRTVAQCKAANKVLLEATTALDIIQDYLGQEIANLDYKIANPESLYKQHGDCSLRVAVILAKRAQLIDLFDRLSPVDTK